MTTLAAQGVFGDGGVVSYNSGFVNIKDNEFYGNGISLTNNNGVISGNTITLTEDSIGIYAGELQNSIFNGNKITSNDDFSNAYALYFNNQNFNSNIFFNNKFDGPVNFLSIGTNTWSTAQTPGTNIVGGSTICGNYWKGFTCTDDGAGICSEDKTIDANNIDACPLALSPSS
jgi:hypothetical protein